MTPISTPRTAIPWAMVWLLLYTSAQAQQRFTQIQASISRWSLASETATSLAASAWGVELDAARWNSWRGIGVAVLVFPGVTGSVPTTVGAQLRGALRSSREVPSSWDPQGDVSVGLGLLRFGKYLNYLAAVCTPMGGCKGYPDFRPGWIPLLSAAAGLDIPLPFGVGLRGEGALDIPVRGSTSPGGGRSMYVRVGLGLTLRP